MSERDLNLLCIILFLCTCSASTVRSLRLLQADMLVVRAAVKRPMDLFLEYWIFFNAFEFSLEISNWLRKAVGATTGFGEVVPIILHLFTGASPTNQKSLVRLITRISEELTNYPCRHLPSLLSLGRHQRVQIWRSSGGGALQQLRSHLQGRRGHDRWACEIESLWRWSVVVQATISINWLRCASCDQFSSIVLRHRTLCSRPFSKQGERANIKTNLLASILDWIVYPNRRWVVDGTKSLGNSGWNDSDDERAESAEGQDSFDNTNRHVIKIWDEVSEYGGYYSKQNSKQTISTKYF